MYSQLGGSLQDQQDKRIFNIGSDIKLSGSNLLARQPSLQAGIQKFLEDHVMKHVAPWKNRQSRLQ
jgi:hypothetical protein